MVRDRSFARRAKPVPGDAIRAGSHSTLFGAWVPCVERAAFSRRHSIGRCEAGGHTLYGGCAPTCLLVTAPPSVALTDNSRCGLPGASVSPQPSAIPLNVLSQLRA